MISGTSQVKSANIQAVVIGADGKIKKNLGTVGYWHRNPLKRLLWAVKQKFKGD